jgi:hypothetical protein
MIDIEVLEKNIQEFAVKYNFVQQKDVNKIESSEPFEKQNYYNIHHKKFINIYQYFNNKIEVAIGIINIEVDEIDEQEWFCINNDDYTFIISINDFTNIDELMAEIINQCKKNNLIL